MVAFLLNELAELEAYAAKVTDALGPTRTRYRYVHDLFVAALLYYTNKFGDEDLNETSGTLFGWAYALRAEMVRVQFASVDNRARGKDKVVGSAFTLLRNATSGRVVRQLSTTPKPAREDHEKELIKLILAKGA
jgi:hypothetical protein